MLKFISTFYFFLAILAFTSAQIIPYGISQDSIAFILNNNYGEDTSKYEIFFYKPLNYDSITSPIIIGIHGQGGNGYSEIPDLKDIADRRKALLVAPTMHPGWDSGIDTSIPDSNNYCAWWLPIVFKELYKHILLRENRYTIPIYLIGFSAGGQFVSRYMLIRQGVPDSIPIRMSVSSNAYYYTFCTDTLNGAIMFYPCGIDGGVFYVANCGTTNNILLGFACNEHIIQYYNENYAVLIGTVDTTGATGMWLCQKVQGNNRYERAQNFYHFSDSDAVARGTTLKWKYGEVPGVAHNQNLMYNTILAGDSMPLAERLLFETPYHIVPQFAPLTDFNVDTTIVSLPNATVHFHNNSSLTSGYLWDFGDNTTSTAINPSHTYQFADTFTVSLIAYGAGCENKLIKHNYIIVKNGVSVNEINKYSGNLQIYPNPSAGQITIKTGNETIETIEIYNNIGIKEDGISVKNNSSAFNYKAKNGLNGLYFIKVKTKENVYTRKIVFR